MAITAPYRSMMSDDRYSDTLDNIGSTTLRAQTVAHSAGERLGSVANIEPQVPAAAKTQIPNEPNPDGNTGEQPTYRQPQITSSVNPRMAGMGGPSAPTI